MAETSRIYPDGDGYHTDMSPSSGTDHYAMVDETPHDSDTTYNAASTNTDTDSFTIPSNALSAIGDSDTINHVDVYAVIKRAGGKFDNTIKLMCRYDSTKSLGSAQTITTGYVEYSSEFSNCPGESGWTKQQVLDAEFGAEATTVLFGSDTRVTQVSIVVDYTAAPSGYTFNAPTTLRIEGSVHTFNSYERPYFEAKFNNDYYKSVGTARVQVFENSSVFATDTTTGITPAWDSGWQALSATVGSDHTCAPFYYNTGDGSYLKNNTPYFFRIQFAASAGGGESSVSPWSTEMSSCRGFQRHWHDYNYDFRREILFETPHAYVATGMTVNFSFQTGNRTMLTDKSHFNEGVQHSGGGNYPIAYYGNKLYVAFIGKEEIGYSNSLKAFINVKDLGENRWGTACLVGDCRSTDDTHNYPTITIDNEGYVHIFYGAHNGPLYYKRSSVPGVVGCFSGETMSSASWTPESTATYNAAYPNALTTPHNNRVYVFYRYDQNQFHFKYINSTAETWQEHEDESSNVEQVIGNYPYAGDDPTRIYPYGFAYDEDKKRLHLAYTLNSITDWQQGVWYLYSDYEDDEDEGFYTWTDLGGTDRYFTNDSPITYNETEPNVIILSSAANGHTHGIEPYKYRAPNVYFIQDLKLFHADGIATVQPMVFLSRKWGLCKTDTRDAGVWEEADLLIAKPSADGENWALREISQQIDKRIRTTRQGCYGLEDENKVMRSYVPIASRTHWYSVPSTVISYSHDETHGIYPTNVGISRVEALDDIPQFNNFETDYLILKCTSGAPSAYIIFDGDHSLNLDHDTTDPLYTIDQVEIEGVVRNKWEDGDTYNSIYFVCSVDGVCYDSSVFSLGNEEHWQRFTHRWYNHPNGNPWTKTSALSAHFGIKNTSEGKTAYVNRLSKKTRVRYSSDEDINDSDLIEIISYDQGDTWSYRYIEGNNIYGRPITAGAKKLINNRIHCVYSRGKYIFHFQDDWDSESNVMIDGRDCVLYYGRDEVPRSINFTNLEHSTVTFQLKESLNANYSTADKSYFLYYGNKNATVWPNSNMSSVYPLYDSFSTIEYEDSLDGFNDWSISAGRALGFVTPPEAARTYAGDRSIKTLLYLGKYPLIKKEIFDSDTTDVIISGVVWDSMNSYTDNTIWLQVVDSDSSHGFKIGLNREGDNNTQHIAYWDGEWHKTHISLGNGGGMHRLHIHVTEKGVTSWYGDIDREYVCREVGTMTALSDVYAQAFNQQRWDYFVGEYSVDKSGDEANAISGADFTMRSLSTHISTYSGVSHAKKEFAEDNSEHQYLEYFTATVNIHNSDETQDWVDIKFNIANSYTYNQNSVIAYATATICDVGAASKSTAFMFHTFIRQDTGLGGEDQVNGTVYPYSKYISFAVDLQNSNVSNTETYGTVTGLRACPRIHDLLVDIGDEEVAPMGFYADATLIGRGIETFKADATIGDYIMWYSPEFSMRVKADISDDYNITLRAYEGLDGNVLTAMRVYEETLDDNLISLKSREDLSKTYNLSLIAYGELIDSIEYALRVYELSISSINEVMRVKESLLDSINVNLTAYESVSVDVNLSLSDYDVLSDDIPFALRVYEEQEDVYNVSMKSYEYVSDYINCIMRVHTDILDDMKLALREYESLDKFINNVMRIYNSKSDDYNIILKQYEDLLQELYLSLHTKEEVSLSDQIALRVYSEAVESLNIGLRAKENITDSNFIALSSDDIISKATEYVLRVYEDKSSSINLKIKSYEDLSKALYTTMETFGISDKSFPLTMSYSASTSSNPYRVILRAYNIISSLNQYTLKSYNTISDYVNLMLETYEDSSLSNYFKLKTYESLVESLSYTFVSYEDISDVKNFAVKSKEDFEVDFNIALESVGRSDLTSYFAMSYSAGASSSYNISFNIYEVVQDEYNLGLYSKGVVSDAFYEVLHVKGTSVEISEFVAKAYESLSEYDYLVIDAVGTEEQSFQFFMNTSEEAIVAFSSGFVLTIPAPSYNRVSVGEIDNAIEVLAYINKSIDKKDRYSVGRHNPKVMKKYSKYKIDKL